MNPRPRSTIQLLVLLAVSALPALSQDESGATAQPGRWHVRGGSAAHAGTSKDPLLRCEPVIGWRTTFDGAIEGEPLCWDGLVWVAVRRDARSVRLEALDLERGLQLAQSPWYETDAPLAPCVWESVVAVRTAPARIELLRLVGGELERTRELAASTAVGPPLLHEGELYFASDEGLQRIDLDGGKSGWRADGTWVGEVALRGERVYGVRYSDGVGELVELDRATAAQLKWQVAGHHDGKVPPVATGLQLAVLWPQIFVQHELPVPTTEGRDAHLIRCDLVSGVEHIGLPVLALPADRDQGWIALLDGGERGRWWVIQPAVEDDDREMLAGEKVHPELLELELEPTLVAGGGYLGALAFDFEDRRIHWRHAEPVLARPVPTRDGVLLVDAGGERLTCWRAPRPSESAWPPAPAAPAPAEIAVGKGRAVLVDRTLLGGNLTVRLGEGQLATGAKGGRGDALLADVLLVEDASERPVWFAGPRALVSACATLAEVEQERAWVELAREALGARHLELAQRYLGRARSLAVPDAGIEKLQKSIADAKKSASRPAKAKADALALKEQAIAALGERVLAERLVKLPADAPAAARVELARAIAARDRWAGDVREALMPLLPAGFDAGAAAPRDLVELAALHGRFPLRCASGAPVDGAPLTAESRALAAAREAGATDAIAFASPATIVICKPASVRAAAAALERGEAVRRVLEQLFPEPPVEGRVLEPLVIRLAASPDELATKIKQPHDDPKISLSSLAVHDPKGNVTHAWIPPDELAEPAALRALAHALVHHWMRARCPRFAHDVTRQMRRGQVGYWAIEGLACWVEDLELDRELDSSAAGALPPTRAAALGLDIVAAASSNGPLDWRNVLGVSREMTERLSESAGARMALDAYLRDFVSVPTLAQYRAQAGAAVRYLLEADDGDYRETLLDYLHAYHIGAADERLDFVGSFEIEPLEFGELVHAWASQQP